MSENEWNRNANALRRRLAGGSYQRDDIIAEHAAKRQALEAAVEGAKAKTAVAKDVAEAALAAYMEAALHFGMAAGALDKFDKEA